MALLLEAYNIEKSFADRQILAVKEFKVYSGDRIGFVGANGCGKTTFLNIITGKDEPDAGRVTKYCALSYAEQFGAADSKDTLGQRLSEFGVRDKAGDENVSGGENTRLKLAEALSGGAGLLIADEPTSNLDEEGIAVLNGFLRRAESFIIVSHDRALLDRHCNKIITIENNDIAEYIGGYTDYLEQVKEARERQMFEYEQYAAEQERLSKVIEKRRVKAEKVIRDPGMSSRERKLRDFLAGGASGGRSSSHKQKSMDQGTKNMQKRLDHMEVKEKPRETEYMRLDFTMTNPPANKIVMSCEKLSFSYGERPIFNDAKFEVRNGARIALYGPNGSGKTTLLRLIHSGHPAVRLVPKAKIGYFRQGFENIDFRESVITNVMNSSVQTERVARGILARLLFRRDDVYKQAGVLSGGERIKLSLAKLLVSNANVLMLDEPTNYLDLPSIEVLQSILCDYEGTVLFVSHDRAFAGAVGTEVLAIENNALVRFEGSLCDYLKPDKMPRDNEAVLLEYKMADLAGRIGQTGGDEKERLIAEYEALAAKRRE